MRFNFETLHKRAIENAHRGGELVAHAAKRARAPAPAALVVESRIHTGPSVEPLGEQRRKPKPKKERRCKNLFSHLFGRED